MALAEPEGYIRTFVDEGEPMQDLLRLAAKSGIRPQYVATLLAAFGTETQAASSLSQPLPDPLSERELEVLWLLAGGLSNQAMAERLFVTLGTVKAHLNNIYSKLDVHTRTQALTRARELGLL